MFIRTPFALQLVATTMAIWWSGSFAVAQVPDGQPVAPRETRNQDLGLIPPVPANDANDADVIDCPPPEAAQSQFRDLSAITVGMQLEGKTLPPDCSQNVFQGARPSAPLRDTLIDFQWAPLNFFHRPLYFEDVPLERYGQSVCPHWQPVISGGRFFLTLPILPYKIGADHPHACVTTLGYRRPGICAPCVMQVPPPLEWDAALLQAGTTVGLVFLLP